MMTTTKRNNDKRWYLVNRRTGTASRAFSTRAQARKAKTQNFRLYDVLRGAYVR